MNAKIEKLLASAGSFALDYVTPGGYVRLPGAPVITAGPAVFEMGDGYAILWATSVKGSGWVTYTFEGKDYTVYDAASGNIRTNDTVHVVKVPKAHLDGNAYQVHSQTVLFKFGYTALKGAVVSSGRRKFRGYHGQEEIQILAVSDVHGHKKEMFAACRALRPEQADLLLLGGDITTTDLTAKAQMVKDIIGTASALSRGRYPVIYARGNHETRGEFAASLKRYFPTETGELYFTFRYGPVAAIVIDPGEDKADDHIEYSGLVDFEAYRQQEYRWLRQLQPAWAQGAQYRLAISHFPSLSDHFSMDWSAELRRLGTQLQLSGHTHDLVLTEKDALNGPGYPVLEDGGIGKDGVFIASRITLKGGVAHFHAVDQSGAVRMDDALPLSAGNINTGHPAD